MDLKLNEIKQFPLIINKMYPTNDLAVIKSENQKKKIFYYFALFYLLISEFLVQIFHNISFHSFYYICFRNNYK